MKNKKLLGIFVMLAVMLGMSVSSSSCGSEDEPVNLSGFYVNEFVICDLI